MRFTSPLSRVRACGSWGAHGMARRISSTVGLIFYSEAPRSLPPSFPPYLPVPASRSLALSPSRPLSRDWQMTGPCLHVSLPRSLLGLVLSLSLSLSLSLWTVFPNKALSLSLRVFLSLVRA